MRKEDIIRKLTSRKLWLSIASFVSMMAVALGHSENEAAQLSALIIAGATVIAYIVGEGLIDSSNKGDGDE
jgi:hypothetical protein